MRFSYFHLAWFLKGFKLKKGYSCTYCTQAIYALVLDVLYLCLLTFFLIPCTHSQSCLSEVKKSYPFLVLYFSWTLYILYIMYIPLLLYGGKSAQQLSYEFNILNKWRVAPKKIKIRIGIWIFQKTFQK